MKYYKVTGRLNLAQDSYQLDDATDGSGHVFRAEFGRRGPAEPLLKGFPIAVGGGAAYQGEYSVFGFAEMEPDGMLRFNDVTAIMMQKDQVDYIKSFRAISMSEIAVQICDERPSRVGAVKALDGECHFAADSILFVPYTDREFGDSFAVKVADPLDLYCELPSDNQSELPLKTFEAWINGTFSEREIKPEALIVRLTDGMLLRFRSLS